MEDLVKKLSERQLTTSEVHSISNAYVPKTPKKSANLTWVDVAKCLLKRVVEQDNAKLAHNVHIFIEISVKAEVKSYMSASKLNHKQCPHISGLLKYIHCLADTDTQPIQNMSELDVGGLKATLFAAVIDLQVTGARSRDEKKLVAELYTKLIAMFEQSSEKLCDCLLLCRCLIYKNHRKPRVLIPLLRQVLCNGNNHSSLQYVSGMHYIKLLLLSKIWLLMVDTKEVSVVYSLVERALKVPEFFSVWLDQNDIPWLRQTDKNHLNVKNILKCMTVSEVLKTVYGANKVTCEILTNIKQETQVDVPQVNKEEMELEYLVTNIKKKKKKKTLEPSQPGGMSRDHKTQMQPSDRNRSRGRRILIPESSKWSTPSDKQQENKVSGSMSELQKGKKSSVSKEEFFSHRKRVRRDSLTFTVTELTEEKIDHLKAKEKVSIGSQTNVTLLDESEAGVKVMKPKTEPPIKPVSEINKDCKVLKPILASPGSYKVLKPKKELTKENTSEEQDSDIKKVVQSDVTLIQNEIDKSQEVLKNNHLSNQSIDEESDSDIEVMEEILVVNSSSKTYKEVECNPSDESDIEEASGTEGNIVPCDDKLKMCTDVENQIYHEKLKEKEQMRKEAEMEPIVLEMLKNDGKEMQEQLKKLSETEQEGTTPKKTNNKMVNKAEVDSNKYLSKLNINATKSCVSKHNGKETVSGNEKIDDNEDIEVIFQTIVSDTGCVERIRNLCERFTSTAEVETNKGNVEPNGNNSEVQIVDTKLVYNEKELKLETKSSNDESIADIREIYKNMSENKLKNETRSVSKSDSKISDIIIMDSNQELKPKTKEETMDLRISGDDSENNSHHKKLDKSALKDNIKNISILINNYIDKGSELIEDNATEKEVYTYIPGAEEELVQSKPSTDSVCTTQEEAKAWLSDQSEVYEASSDASEEHIRTSTHIIRKKMSERKCSAALANAQITSDSDMSPVRHTQRGRRSSDKSKIHKKINIQTSSIINLAPLDKSMASVSLLHNINDSSFESNFSSTSLVSTDMQMDGSCATVMPAPATTIITNGSVRVKDSMHNSDSDTLVSRNDTSMVSENLSDNSKTGLDKDKTVVADTISPDDTEDVLEEETNKEDVEPLRNDSANMSDIFDSATNSKIIENGNDFGENKVIAKISLEQEEPSPGEAVDVQKNTESLLLTKDLVDINEYEELEVLSKSGVDDDGEKHVSVSPCVNQSKNTLSPSSQPVSPHSSSSLLLKSTTPCRQSSQTQGKIVGDTDDKSAGPALAPQSQILNGQALHKEFIISPSVPCKLNNQSQIKAIVTEPSSSTTEDSHKQNLAKYDSKENNKDKNHDKNIMNESLKNKINKADKKNDKLKVGENYDRINYLVQASRMVFKNDKSVSSQLGSLAISFGRRLPQVRLDPLLKREMCKGCGVYLVYGVNARVRHRSKRQKHLVVTCLTCHTIKRFLTNPNHKLWSEQPEAQL